MSIRHTSLVVVLSWIWLAPVMSAAQIDPKIQQFVVDRLAPVFGSGDDVSTLRLLIPVVARSTPGQLEQVDAALAEEGIPSFARIMADARLDLLNQDLLGNVPKPSSREVQSILPTMQQLIATRIETHGAADLMAGDLPSPANMDEYESIFWRLHVADNELENLKKLVRYAVYLEQFLPRKRRSSRNRTKEAKPDTDSDKAPAPLDLQKLATALGDQHQRLLARRSALRYQRLNDAGLVLANSDDFTEKFKAAYAAQMDGELLLEHFRRRRLGDAEKVQLQVVKDNLNYVRKEHADLAQKSRWLHAGLHWWLRGRYGLGAEKNGLLKSEQALKSKRAQFALYMPKELPHPVDPLPDKSDQAAIDQYQQNQDLPRFQRRHHHIWRFEYRRIYEGLDQSSQTYSQASVTRRPETKITTRFFY